MTLENIVVATSPAVESDGAVGRRLFVTNMHSVVKSIWARNRHGEGGVKPKYDLSLFACPVQQLDGTPVHLLNYGAPLLRQERGND